MDLKTILLIILGLGGLILAFIILSFFSVWLRAWLAGAYVGFSDLIAMRLRQVCKSSELCGQHIVLAANHGPTMLESLGNRLFQAGDALIDLRDRVLIKFSAHLADESRMIGNRPIQ